MIPFKVHTPYTPAGDQPQAIEQLTASIKQGNKYNTLLGVTGSGLVLALSLRKHIQWQKQ
jgi:excinuclease ABC subunit B